MYNFVDFENSHARKFPLAAKSICTESNIESSPSVPVPHITFDIQPLVVVVSLLDFTLDKLDKLSPK